MCISAVIDFIIRIFFLKILEKKCYCENSMPNQINWIKYDVWTNNIQWLSKVIVRICSDDSKLIYTGNLKSLKLLVNYLMDIRRILESYLMDIRRILESYLMDIPRILPAASWIFPEYWTATSWTFPEYWRIPPGYKSKSSGTTWRVPGWPG